MTWFVYKEGGRGRSSPAVPPPSVWEEAAKADDYRLSQGSRLQDELEAGLFWADVMTQALGGFSGCMGVTDDTGEYTVRDSCNSVVALGPGQTEWHTRHSSLDGAFCY